MERHEHIGSFKKEQVDPADSQAIKGTRAVPAHPDQDEEEMIDNEPNPEKELDFEK